MEENENLSPEEILKCQLAKGMFYFFLGNYREAIKIGKVAYDESLGQKKPLFAIDALFTKYAGCVTSNQGYKVRNYANLCKDLLKSVISEQQSEVEKRKVYCYHIQGSSASDLDTAIRHQRKALKILEKHNSVYYLKASILNRIGLALTEKGEYNLAINSLKEAIDCSKGKSRFVILTKAANYHDIAYIRGLQGEIETSIALIEKSQDLFLKLSKIPLLYVGFNYALLISIYLKQNSISKAKDCLQEFQQYNDKLPLPENMGLYKLNQAQILKASTRIQDWTEAMNILKDMISTNTWITYGISELCDLYLRELQITNDPKILDNCQPLIEKLLKITQNSNYYFNVYAHLLQGKISLLKMNLGDARRYLTKAQDSAEHNGLQLLAQEVSVEHDKLLEQLGEWENLKNKKVSYEDRMNLAKLEETIEGILGRRGVNPPKLQSEQPLLLSIITEGGVLLFSYAFTKEWERDNEFFGSFLSAFSSFSDEYFSEGLDRAKFGKYTVLLDSVKSFTICFLFAGQSYQAKQKLARFVELLKDDSSIQEALEKIQETNQVLELHDFPFLKSLIHEIFVKN
ncbi:MAG: hypothetical protein ACXABO_19905 [Promethearchaeota archaeon]